MVKSIKGYISVIPIVHLFQMRTESQVLCLQIPNIRILLENREQEGSCEASGSLYLNEDRQTLVCPYCAQLRITDKRHSSASAN